jgi:glycosyltransferase involved in cell wall biosynthesis
MKISVIVPVRNEEDSIRVLLEGLLAQTRPPDEIVITDGGSTDRTAEIIEEYARRGAPVHLIRERAALPGRGRNLAAAQASSEWLAFTDAGIRPAGNWLAALSERALQEPTAEVIYGAWEPVMDSFFKECAAIVYVPSHIARDGALMRPRSIASALMRREVWRAVGGFPEHLRSAEDILFMDAVERTGARTIYAPRAVVHWNIQPTLWRTFRRFATYSRHNIRAGLWREWQAAIFKRYAALLLIAVAASFFTRWWFLMTAMLWLLMLVARALVALRRNRPGSPASATRNAQRLFLIVPIIATLDAAALVGTINWMMTDKLHLGGSSPAGAGDGA